MSLRRQSLSVLFSGALHAGALAAAWTMGGVPHLAAEGLGAGEADFGGTATTDADYEAEAADNALAGPFTRLLSIGIVVDTPAAPPAAAAVAVEAAAVAVEPPPQRRLRPPPSRRPLRSRSPPRPRSSPKLP